MKKITQLSSVLVSSLALATAAHSAPIQWSTSDGGNGHWYDFVVLSAAISTSDAETTAESSVFMGETGYLATITSAAEQAFLNLHWPGAGAITGQFRNYSYFLIGASDRDTEGTFEWIGGDEEGSALAYTNFKPGEPNNNNGSGGEEDYVVAWWEDSAAGVWNDVGASSNVLGYLVEYNEPTTSTPPVPLPASLPLMAVAFGGLAFMRRKKSA